MTSLETAALRRWRDRELTYPKFTRRMTPDALDMETGAWALNVAATKQEMEAAMQFPVGSLVKCYIPGHEGNSDEPAIVIGHMSYEPKVACLATERHHGCPVNEAHLTLVGKADDDEALRLRQRYLDLYGTTRFIALHAKENTNG